MGDWHEFNVIHEETGTVILRVGHRWKRIVAVGNRVLSALRPSVLIGLFFDTLASLRYTGIY